MTKLQRKDNRNSQNVEFYAYEGVSNQGGGAVSFELPTMGIYSASGPTDFLDAFFNDVKQAYKNVKGVWTDCRKKLLDWIKSIW